MTATDGKIECPLCLLELPPVEFPDLGHCDHRACYECLQQYLRIEISESRVNMMCPECTEPIHPNDIRIILNDEEMLSKYESFMLRRVLVAEPDARWCPAPDCSYVVIASGCAGCPKLQCNRPGCNTFFCYHCKHEWHPNQTCDAARAQRNVRIASSRASGDFDGHSIHVSQRDSEIKPCPTCKVLVIKMDDGSCNHMTCSVCGTEFCWLCMKQITDLHYLSPSGCTFWGKKPWSRKKKILWQLGMLVGAPVGVALIAGIAVPAIIIGVPVWVGRKLHSRFERQSMRRHKRNLLIASGVVTSVLVTPILAAVAVGIGVPILLAYVYGVVPISLCRSGGCGGLNRSESDAKLDLEEGLANSSSKNANALDRLSVDTALSASRPNPSIGEMSFGLSASLYMGSGSHLDRAAGDRESASNAPLAGSIASHRVEVTADVSSNKRYSFSSGHSEAISCAVSLSERSANISNYDDLSVRGLAGSIMSRVHHGVTPVSNLSREDEVSSHVVTSPVETVITVEAQAVPPPPMTTSGTMCLLPTFGSRRCRSRQEPII
ncbi:E3 ubiquitin-protein ligase RNF19A [Halotydeus destructor]|nr:E3 ubiquitin-protein ligase RNF19A [Halotydeus destructor]